MLCDQYLREFSIKLKLFIQTVIIIDYIMKIIPIIMYLVLCFIAFSPYGLNYSIIIYNFWYSLLFIGCNSLVSLIMSYFCEIFILSLYLKYRFRQIYENIVINTRTGIQWLKKKVLIDSNLSFIDNYLSFIFSFIARMSLWIKIMKDFNDLCLITSIINNSTKEFNLYSYYISIPLINVCIIAALYEEQIILLLILLWISILGIIVIFWTNYCLSSIAEKSHSLYKPLNSVVVRNVLNLELKLKICSMIERISGPVIGLYCYDLFPFTITWRHI